MAENNVAVIRSATSDDVEAIRNVGLITWPATYAFAGQEYVDQGLARWWSVEAIGGSLHVTNTYVAEVDGVLVGMGNIDLRPELPTIWKLYVVPGYHGRGIGKMLMTRLLRDAPSGSAGVVLEYIDGNDRAASFYRGQGFTELRREDGDVAGWPQTVWMIHRTRVAEP